MGLNNTITNLSILGIEEGEEQDWLAGITKGTATANDAMVVDANKDISGVRNLGVTNLDAGASGTAGSVDIFPSTASKGKAAITCTNQTGDTTVGVVVGAMGQATTITVPDPGQSTANVILSAGAQTVGGVKTFSSKIEAELGVSDADLILESLNPLQINLNDTAALQADNADITTFAAAADTAGTDVYITTADAGTASGDAEGEDGGDLFIMAGDGVDGGAHTSNHPSGGIGGSIFLAPGVGGALGAGGSGKDGRNGRIKCAAGMFQFMDAQTVLMGDGAVVLTTDPEQTAGVELLSNVIMVDAESSGTEDLTLPSEYCDGMVLFINNFGGESVIAKDAGGNTVATITAGASAILFSNGDYSAAQNWFGGLLS